MKILIVLIRENVENFQLEIHLYKDKIQYVHYHIISWI